MRAWHAPESNHTSPTHSGPAQGPAVPSGARAKASGQLLRRPVPSACVRANFSEHDAPVAAFWWHGAKGKQQLRAYLSKKNKFYVLVATAIAYYTNFHAIGATGYWPSAEVLDRSLANFLGSPQWLWC